MPEKETTGRRKLTWRGKLLLAVGAPVVFLGLVELVLALAGYQVREVEPYYERFPARKRAGSVRILVVGGSAAAGYPFSPRGGPAAFLRELLRDIAPGQPTEVFNCAANALNSKGVVMLVRRLVKYEPHILIVYSGHNEFHNNPRRNREVAEWNPQGPCWLFCTRTYALLKDMALLFRGGPPRQPFTRAERAATGRLGSPANYKLGVLAPPYEANLRELVQTAASKGVSVVLTTLASNLSGAPPSLPEHREGLTGDELAAWRGHYEKGRALAKAGRHREALSAFEKAGAIDGTHAGLLYEQARCHFALEHFARAKELFVAARDADYLPMRATTPRNEVVRRVAGLPDVALADAEAAFAEASPRGIPGDEPFCDHVHLSLRGAMLLARCWARTLETAGLLGARAGWDWSRARPQEDYERAAGLEPEFLAAGHAEMGVQCARAEAGGRLVAAYRRPQFLEHVRRRGSRHFATALRLAPQVVEAALAEREAYISCYIARAHLDLGRAEKAVKICKEVVDAAPRLALAYRYLGEAYAACGQMGKASAARERLRELQSPKTGGGS